MENKSAPTKTVPLTEKGITFLTDSMGSVTVTGGRSNPRGAAAALLKDIINIYRQGADSWQRPVELRRSGSEPQF